MSDAGEELGVRLVRDHTLTHHTKKDLYSASGTNAGNDSLPAYHSVDEELSTDSVRVLLELCDDEIPSKTSNKK